MLLTPQTFAKMIPTNKNPDIWFQPAVEMFKKYDINTENRIAGFMSQTAHESGDFQTVVENLNYSWQGLRKTFGKYFKTDEEAKKYHRKPEEIANVVYANRMGNGNTASGDGWRFRGRGLIQLTGRNNMTAFANSIKKTPENAALYCETPKGALESACWFWKTNNLNRFCDANDINGLSRAVNGGTNGLSDRIKRYNDAKAIL
jgi:putative chitinase